MTGSLIYRTNDPLQWGAGKGSRLVPGEVDQNFWDLERRMDAAEANPALPREIADIQVIAGQMFITLSDYSVSGPFTLPTSAFRYTGAFQPEHDYKLNDFLTAGNGLYLVLHDFTSGADFVFGSDDDGPWYQFIMPFTATQFVKFSYGFTPAADFDEGAIVFLDMFAVGGVLPVGLAGSAARLVTAAADAISFPIYKNEELVGSVDFAEYELAGTFAFESEVEFAAGDLLIVRASAVTDQFAEGLAIDLAWQLATP